MVTKKERYKITYWIQYQCMESPNTCGWVTRYEKDDKAGNDSALNEMKDHIAQQHKKVKANRSFFPLFFA